MNLMAPSQLLRNNGPFCFDQGCPPPPPPALVPSTLDVAYDYFYSSALPPLPLPDRGVHSFDRPDSSRSLPMAGRYQKKFKQMAGMGMTGEEFDALPVAVRRKYFSTLERLRFAQSSRPDAVNDRPRQRLRKGSLADRRGLDLPFLEPRRKTKALRPSRGSGRSNSVSSSDASWFMTLPEKIRQRQFTQEEQDLLSGRLHEHYILDATDEAIYKATRGAHRQLTPPSNSDYRLPSSPTRPSPSFDYRRPGAKLPMADTVLESFRWMDEEDDLDLKLVLDDYHANLDGAVIPSLDNPRRPSFRRRLSISNMPFNSKRSPSLQSRPPTSSKFDATHHIRQRSRALSLMAPRHGPKASVSSIDPSATHYQDPEARLKLRAYLASPQKFDEAIEFGFPSIDGVADDKENKPPRLSADIIGRKSQSTEKSRSFFWKDVEMASLFDDDSSAQDPESPLTPMFADSRRPSVPPKDGPTSSDFTHLGITKPLVIKQPESYTHAATGSREMTLRMTLTRPDLRADDTALYGWQTSRSPLREEPLALEESEEKAEVRGPFGGIDGWGAEEKENGVVKRFWNKVKSSQRKIN